jgi:hypothetical protein
LQQPTISSDINSKEVIFIIATNIVILVIIVIVPKYIIVYIQRPLRCRLIGLFGFLSLSLNLPFGLLDLFVLDDVT